MTDPSTLTRDQLERLATAWFMALDAHMRGSRSASGGFLDTANAILAEPRQAPVPTDREMVEAWVATGDVRRTLIVTVRADGVYLQLVELSSTAWQSAPHTTLDAAYAAAAAWVREQGK